MNSITDKKERVEKRMLSKYRENAVPTRVEVVENILMSSIKGHLRKTQVM